MHRIEALRAFIESQPASAGVESQATLLAKAHFFSSLNLVQARVEQVVEDADGPDEIDLTLGPLNYHTFRLGDLADAIFMRPSSSVPKPLIRNVQTELRNLGLDVVPLVAVSEPGNFFTFRAGLWDEVHNAEALGKIPSRPRTEPDVYVLQVPALEGNRNLWLPIIAGHEVAHLYAYAEDLFETNDLVDTWVPDSLEGVIPIEDWPTNESEVRESVIIMLNNWAREVYCDLYSVKRFGPAGLLSLIDLMSVGDTNQEEFDEGEDHPPVWFRLEAMASVLGCGRSFTYGPLISRWERWAAERKRFLHPAREALLRILSARIPDIQLLVEQTPTRRYAWRRRQSKVREIAEQLGQGFPLVEFPESKELKDSKVAQVADILNAGWLSVHSRDRKPSLSQIDALVGKGMDTVDFIANTRGVWVVKEGEAAPWTGETQGQNHGVLSIHAIRARLAGANGVKPLRITPSCRLQGAGASIDLRVGRGFITFRRTATNGWNIQSDEFDPRVLQEYVEKDWNEGFVLHPGELVLAATLEYIAMPDDLTGQVVTRSSYGRLGLMTATAMQVQPEYIGCLTLQLINLGQIPMTLRPGERIAQLVLSHVSPPVKTAHEKYAYAVGPEFSRFHLDRENRRQR